MPEHDPVNHPSHYTDGKYECIDFIEGHMLGFCLGNAVKYISRAGKKEGVSAEQDLKKALWYVERQISNLDDDHAFTYIQPWNYASDKHLSPMLAFAVVNITCHDDDGFPDLLSLKAAADMLRASIEALEKKGEDE